MLNENGESVVTKRRFISGILATIAAYSLACAVGFAGPQMTQRRALPLGRYNCASVNDPSPMSDLKLLSRDRYESMEQTGIYDYEAGSGKIEWLTGPVSKQRVGFYVPRGTGNAQHDTIVIRSKKDVEEGIERGLYRCSLAE